MLSSNRCDFLAKDKRVIINTRGLVNDNSESNATNVNPKVNGVTNTLIVTLIYYTN